MKKYHPQTKIYQRPLGWLSSWFFAFVSLPPKVKVTIAALGFGLIAFLGIMNPVPALAISNSDIPTDIQGSSTSGMQLYDSPSNKTGACLGQGNDYDYFYWLSEAGKPANDGPETIAYGKSSISLQLNNLTFLCHVILTNPKLYYVAGSTSDSAPISDALTQISASIKIVSVQSSIGAAGTLTPNFDNSQRFTTTYANNSNTRFWQANGTNAGAIPVTYTPKSGSFTQSQTITITLDITPVNTFHNGPPNGSYVCVSGGTAAKSGTAPSNCGSGQITLHIQINVPTTNVTGKVYNLQTGEGIANANIINCYNNGSQVIGQTGADGTFSVPMGIGESYCLSAQSGSKTFNIRPYNDGASGTANEYTKDCQNFNGTKNPNYCVDQTYRCQIAGSATDEYGSGKNSGCTDNSNGDVIYNRGIDDGYQFVYNPPPPPPPDVTIQGEVINQATGKGKNGVEIESCSSNPANDFTPVTTATSGGNAGQFAVQIPKGQEFCLSVAGNAVNGSAVHINPNNSNVQYSSDCQDSNNNCTEQTYRCQYAGVTTQDSSCKPPYNRATDYGYRFVYNGDVAAQPAATSKCVNGYPSITVSDTSAGTGTVKYVITGPHDSTTVTSPEAQSKTVSLPQYTGINSNNFTVTANFTSGNTQTSQISVPNVLGCAQPTCELSFAPATLETNVPDQVTAAVSWGSTTSGGTLYYGKYGSPLPTSASGFPTIKLSVNGVGQTATSSTFSAPNGTQNYVNMANIYSYTPPAGGTYSFTETVTGYTAQGTCTSSNGAFSQPYTKVFGGDTIAGSGFDVDPSGCVVNPNAGAYAWSMEDIDAGTTRYRGSSTNEGSFATALVDGYVTASGRTAGYGTQGSYTGGVSSAGPPDSLTFGNSSTGVSGDTFGGYFGTDLGDGDGANCIPDYYTTLENSSYKNNLPTQATTTISSNPLSGTTSPGNRVVDLSDNSSSTPSTVVINSNITPSAWSYSASNPTANIPLFYLVVRGGNIYINQNVTNLYGVYIAEPNSKGVGGNIYTCTSGSTLYTPNGTANANNLFNATNSCQKDSLQVDGSFVARDIHFLRTGGTVGITAGPCQERYESGGTWTADPSGASTGSESFETPTCNNAGESFIYSPSQWLVDPLGSNSQPGALNLTSRSPIP